MNVISHIDWPLVIVVALVYVYMIRSNIWKRRFLRERRQHRECHHIFDHILSQTEGGDKMLMILNPELDAERRRQ
jgi:hypothetical protein